MKNISFFKYCMLIMAAIAMISFTACSDDDENGEPDDNGNGDVLVEDGFYIKGDGTVLTDLNFLGLMKVTRNEFTQTNRLALLELYIAVEEGAEGFNIVEVSGAETFVYGPGADFELVPEADRITDEPRGDFWRGSYVETNDPFTVPESGLYHVVIDKQYEVVIVAHVEYWGLIGGATPGGWADDTKMEPEAFDLEQITFKVEDAGMALGEFKFRYAGGWKIIVVEDEDILVNANFGTSIDELVPGGGNIQNETSGLYDFEMIWSLADGYSVNMERTGDLPKTDWTGVELDMVGDGVSDDNADAIPDPSAWNWGNVIYPDPNEPDVDGDLYTWTWDSVILEADEGFKIRTKNGEAPPVGGANFDVGFDAVDTDASSDNVADNSGNISVTVKGEYKVVIVIDADDEDRKTVTITEVD